MWQPVAEACGRPGRRAGEGKVPLGPCVFSSDRLSPSTSQTSGQWKPSRARSRRFPFGSERREEQRKAAGAPRGATASKQSCSHTCGFQREAASLGTGLGKESLFPARISVRMSNIYLLCVCVPGFGIDTSHLFWWWLPLRA